MNLIRPTLLALAAMTVFLIAGLLYTLPRRAPDLDKARSDFMRANRSTSIESVELDTITADVIAFRIHYRGFASNERREEVLTYEKIKGQGWHLK